MHTKHPNKCLSELARILKVKGQSWIYIYGAGGFSWRIIYHLREMMKDVKIQECITGLKLYRYSTRYVAEFIDDWYATYLRTYTNKDLSKRLSAVGFEKPELLKFGLDYDTSHRRNKFTSSAQKVLMGHGDLRYLLTKRSNEQTQNDLVLEGEYGSEYNWQKTITEKVDPLFKKLNRICKDHKWLKIAAAAHIQRELRLEMTKEESLNLNKITAMISEVIALAQSTKKL
jgi:hypothetical protein